jgi:hypothetical protein
MSAMTMRLPSTFDVLEGCLSARETSMAKKTKKTKKTNKTKKRIVRREYTKEDVKELRAHSKAKTSVAKLAKITKRTEGSLRQKALKLGIRLGHRR